MEKGTRERGEEMRPQTGRQREVRERRRCVSGQTPRESEGTSAKGRAEQARGEARAGLGPGASGGDPGRGCSFLFGKERRKPERNAQNTDHSHQPLLTKHIPRAAPGPDPGLGGASLHGPLPK